MNTRIALALISFSVAMSGIFIANLLLYVTIGEINRKRQTEPLVSYFGFTFPKVVRVFREYRAAYPQGAFIYMRSRLLEWQSPP